MPSIRQLGVQCLRRLLEQHQPFCPQALSRLISTSPVLSKGGQRRLRMADDEDIPVKKRQVVKAKVVLTSQDVDELIRKRQELLRPAGDFYKKKPIDDVWMQKDYPTRTWSLSECIENHRQACAPAMFDNPHGVVTANLMLCMRMKKKTKFQHNYSGTIVLPHLFDTGMPKRKILALAAKPEDLEIAQKYKAELYGDIKIIREINSDEIVFEEDGIEIVICTTDLLTDLLTIKSKLPSFPTKKTVTTGFDMETMMRTHTDGVYYETKPFETDNPLSHKVSVPIGRLDMPLEELQTNWQYWVDTLENLRSVPALGSVILDATITCKPSPEEFKLSLESPTEEGELSDDEEEVKDEYDSDDESDTKVKAKR